MRFFVNAISQYDAGLRAFPTSFDLAYNKARLQYDITQQPQLLEQLPDSRADLLNAARDSHIFAYRLDNGNTDVLFNLGQVCSSLAESMLEARGDPSKQRLEASRLLHQALEVLNICLRLQEKQLEEAKLLTQTTTSAADESSHASDGDQPIAQDTEDIWASVIEPLTEEDLFDTCLATVEALKSLCQIQNSGDKTDLGLIETVFSSGIREKLQQYGQGSGQAWQSTIALANFLSAYAELRFRLRVTSLPIFENEINSSVDLIRSLPQYTNKGEGLVTLGEIHLDYNLAVEGFLEPIEGSQELGAAMNKSRWEHITRALESFTAASKLPSVSHLARIHIYRGDCELLRIRLGDHPCNYHFAVKSHATLLKNVEVYYRAAKRASSYDKSGSPEDTLEIDVKLAITALFQNSDTQPLLTLLTEDKSKVSQQLADIGQHGLLGGQMATRIQQVLEQ